MDLTFQVPMQYCSLQHQTLLLSPVTSTTGYWFCFGSMLSFFLELFLHWSLVAYWAPTNLGSSSFSILSCFLFILFMGFSRQEYRSDLPFPSPVDHILSDLSTMTRPSWVAPWAWLSFIELDKAVVLVWSYWLVSVSMVSVCLPCVASHNTYCLTWVSLTLDVGYLFMAAPAKCSCCSLPCRRGIASQPPLLTLNVGGVAPLGPPAPFSPWYFVIAAQTDWDTHLTNRYMGMFSRRWPYLLKLKHCNSIANVAHK